MAGAAGATDVVVAGTLVVVVTTVVVVVVVGVTVVVVTGCVGVGWTVVGGDICPRGGAGLVSDPRDPRSAPRPGPTLEVGIDVGSIAVGNTDVVGVWLVVGATVAGVTLVVCTLVVRSSPLRTR